MPTSRCWMIESSSSCTTSIGSSIVTMWARRDRLMCPIMAAIVVVFPVPVGPVTSTRPRGASASVAHHGRQAELLERRDLRADPAHREADHAPLAEHVDAEPAHPGQRVADVGLARRLEARPLVVAHHGSCAKASVSAAVSTA